MEQTSKRNKTTNLILLIAFIMIAIAGLYQLAKSPVPRLGLEGSLWFSITFAVAALGAEGTPKLSRYSPVLAMIAAVFAFITFSNGMGWTDLEIMGVR